MESICAAFQHIGYKRHPSIKNKLIIDEQVKDIVEKIFDMYANGHGSVENGTHEAIIDKDTFEKVQCIFEKRGTNTKLKYDYLLRGLLYCYHCKRKLQIVLKKNSKRNSTSHPYITCSDHKKRGCYPLSINYEKFENHIIYVVKKICQVYADKEIFYSVYEKYQNKTLDIRDGYKKKIEQIDKSILEINNNLDKMYMDKLQGIILEEDYIRVSREIYI